MYPDCEQESVRHRTPVLEVPQMGFQPRPFPWIPWLARPPESMVGDTSVEAAGPQFHQVFEAKLGLALHHLRFLSTAPSAREDALKMAMRIHPRRIGRKVLPRLQPC